MELHPRQALAVLAGCPLALMAAVVVEAEEYHLVQASVVEAEAEEYRPA